MRRTTFSKLIVIGSILLAGALPGMAGQPQSINKDSPTRLTSDQLSGTFTGKDKKQFYYVFPAGPGELVMTLDVEGLNKTIDSGAVTGITLFDPDFNKIANFDARAGFNGESVRVVRRYQVPTRQMVIMEVVSSERPGKYNLRIGGAADFGQTPQPSISVGPFTLPKVGILTVKMKDGSVHTIDLADVQTVNLR